MHRNGLLSQRIWDELLCGRQYRGYFVWGIPTIVGSRKQLGAKCDGPGRT